MELHACHVSVIDLGVLTFKARILSVVITMVQGLVTTVVSC
jgi:hypothetical protein